MLRGVAAALNGRAQGLAWAGGRFLNCGTSCRFSRWAGLLLLMALIVGAVAWGRRTWDAARRAGRREVGLEVAVTFATVARVAVREPREAARAARPSQRRRLDQP